MLCPPRVARFANSSCLDRRMAMDTNKIAELLRPYAALDARQLAYISIYIDLVSKWNARINLTAVRRPEEIVTRHFGESFFTGQQLLGPDTVVNTIIDLGSGAGFPGLPMALLAPRARVILIESSGKKAAFLNEVIRTLDLSNAQVFLGRGEDYPGMASLVMMRAVEKFEKAIDLAATLVEPGGRLALMIGRDQIGMTLAQASDLAWKRQIAIPGGHSRILLVGTKSVKVGIDV